MKLLTPHSKEAGQLLEMFGLPVEQVARFQLTLQLDEPVMADVTFYIDSERLLLGEPKKFHLLEIDK